MTVRTPLSTLCVLVGLAVSAYAAAPTKRKGAAMPRFGFRHDPMKYAAESDTYQAVLVRRLVFGKPNPGDAAIVKKRIAEILAGQKADGTLGDGEHHSLALLSELADLGADPKRPEMKRAVEAVRRKMNEKKWVRGIRPLCMLGLASDPAVKAIAEHHIRTAGKWNGAWKLCPWGATFYVKALWPARDVAEVSGEVKKALTWMADGLNPAGCQGYKDPWGFVDAAAHVATPEAKHLAEKLIPVILRGQEPDGGWGGGGYDSWSKNSLRVFMALTRHGLFEKLRTLPPLPPDWTIVRTIPAPSDQVRTLTFDGKNLWTLDHKANEAIALSPADGAVTKRLTIPFDKAFGLAWWDGGLGVSQQEPKRLVRLDPETGKVTRELALKKQHWVHGFEQVGEELWVGDAWMGCVLRIGLKDGKKGKPLGVGGPQPNRFAPTPDGVWHLDDFAPLLIKNSHKGKVLDWADKPFEGRCDGIAWNGNDLWALDAKTKRIGIIRRRGTAGAHDR